MIYVPAELLADDAVRASLAVLLGAGGASARRASGEGADAGHHPAAGVEIESLDLDTAVMAYLIDPGEGKYDLAALVGRYCGIELVSPDAPTVEGTLDLDGDAAGDDAGRRAAAVSRLAPELRAVLDARELWTLYDTVERPLIGVLAVMETAGIRVDREFLDQMRTDLQKRCDELDHEDPRSCRGAVRRQLRSPAAADPVRGAGAHPGEAHQDGPVDRRGLAAEDGRRG